MSSKHSSVKTIVYTNMLLLTIDIENSLKNVNVSIDKFYFHFIKYNVESSHARPYFIKFNTIDKVTGTTEEYKWTAKEMYEILKFIPLYRIYNNITAEFNTIDINDKLYPLSDPISIEKLREFERKSYDYELKHNGIIVSVEILNKIESLLQLYEVGYEVHYAKYEDESSSSDEQYPSYIVVYKDYAETAPSYNIIISLDNRPHNDTGYCISPNPIEFSQFASIGVFKTFGDSYVNIPSEDHIAVITACDECEAPIICDWLQLKGTKCPYCDTMKIV